MAANDYAIYIDNDSSDNYAAVAYRTPATVPSGGTRLPIPWTEAAQGNSVATAITNATNATPIVVTSTAHGLSVDSVVFISGVLGNVAANGTFVVSAVADANTFTLRDSAGSGSYTSGGYATKLSRTKNLRTALEMALQAVVTDKAAGN